MGTEIVELRLPMLKKPYKYTGEYRPVKYDERYIHNGEVCLWSLQEDSEASYPVIEREVWVPVVGENFYVVNGLGFVEDRMALSPAYLKSCINSGNYFKTSKLAESAGIVLRLALKDMPHE